MVKFKASIEAQQPDPVMDLTMCLLNSVTATHIQHFITTSYSQHVALQEFYESVGDLVDEFVESFQGLYGVLTDFPTAYEIPVTDPLQYMAYLQTELKTLRRAPEFPQDSELQNSLDEIATLINRTKYKLERLK
jgi:hypothetical protein